MNYCIFRIISLSYTWARRGQQPEVKTSGKRKGYKVFGAIECFSGRLFAQGIEGRFTSDNYQACLQTILAHTTEHRCGWLGRHRVSMYAPRHSGSVLVPVVL